MEERTLLTPKRAQEFRVAYFECKRGQLDMRTRIRGPKGGMTKPEDK